MRRRSVPSALACAALLACGLATAGTPTAAAQGAGARYVGYAPMSGFDTDDEVWVRRGELTIEGERVRLDTHALACTAGTVRDADDDDGGAYAYEGTLSGDGPRRFARLRETACSGCGDRATRARYLLPVRIEDDGSVLLGGVRMTRDAATGAAQCPSFDPATSLPPDTPPDPPLHP